MKSLGRIWVVGANTFREATRNRAFIALMIASLALILSSLLLAQLAVLGQEKRIIKDFGLFFISIMGVLISVTIGVILVYKELDRKTIYPVLARPLHRWEFLLGKYLGMILILLVEMGALSVVWLIVLRMHGVAIELVLVEALALIFAELMLVSAVAVLFSSFSTPILSGVLTMAFFISGRVIYLVEEMLHSTSPRVIFNRIPALRPLGEGLARTIPDLSVFNLTREILLGKEVTSVYMWQAWGYALSYVVVLLVAACVFFQRRDFV